MEDKCKYVEKNTKVYEINLVFFQILLAKTKNCFVECVYHAHRQLRITATFQQIQHVTGMFKT